MSKYPEAKVSLIVPTLLNGRKSIDIYNELVNKTSDILFVNIIKIDGIELMEEQIQLISNVKLTEDQAYEYYFEILSYYMGVEDKLSESEIEIRENEVKEKWLNGNYNYWILDKEV